MKIGNAVPNIKFNIFHNKDIYEVSLENYKDKWIVLFFYPADFTFVCPTELEGLAKAYDDFKKLNAEVISVSRDSAFVHKAWKESEPRLKDINYPMAADVKGELGEMFSTLAEDGLSYRATIIISPERIVKSIEINDNNVGRNIQETFRKLQALTYVSKNKGQVCPLNWSPDKEALKLPEYTVLKK